MEVAEGFANIQHNSMNTLTTLYIIPNGIWILSPFFGLLWCFSTINNALASQPKTTPKNKSKTPTTKKNK